MSTAGTLRHDALLYDSDLEWLETLVPFVHDGLARGEPVVAVTTETNIAGLEKALGADASRVSFIDAVDWYVHPARTIAAYHGVLEQQDPCSLVRVIGEVQFGDTEDEHREWIRYEAALNRAFANARAWIVCPYDRRVLPRWVVRHAEHAHPYRMEANARRRNAAYTAPNELFSRLATLEETPSTAVAAVSINGDLAPARRELRRIADREGMEAERVEHLVLAANEVLTNAIVHGSHPIDLRVHRENDTLICDVADAGAAMHDQIAGYVPPPADDRVEAGRGLWMARQLCDHVGVHTDRARTLVRLAMKVTDDRKGSDR